MKSLTRKGLIAIALSVSLMGFASDLKRPIKEKEPKVTSLSFAKVSKGSKLLIKDLNGIVLYKEAIQKSGEYSKLKEEETKETNKGKAATDLWDHLKAVDLLSKYNENWCEGVLKKDKWDQKKEQVDKFLKECDGNKIQNGNYQPHL